MQSPDLDQLLDLARKASLEAGDVILDIYDNGDFSIEAKADNSPLTIADRKAHECIVKHLQNSEIPVLSEEGKNIPFEERKDWDYFWMVDPLDGTKEFIKKNGEFTVNIALIHKNFPILGVVYTPVLKKLYSAIDGKGAFMEFEGEKSLLKTSGTDIENSKVNVVASRSHINEDTQKFIDQFQEVEILSMGSSLKFMLVAEGKADVYPRIAPTMEWDTAAAQIVVSEAGGKVLNFETKKPVQYNKENLLNPYFVVYNK